MREDRWNIKLINSTLATRSERGTWGGQKRKYDLDRRVRLAVRSERVWCLTPSNLSLASAKAVTTRTVKVESGAFAGGVFNAASAVPFSFW
jgi:hypothetical protein